MKNNYGLTLNKFCFPITNWSYCSGDFLIQWKLPLLKHFPERKCFCFRNRQLPLKAKCGE